jgi:hypothetical protein
MVMHVYNVNCAGRIGRRVEVWGWPRPEKKLSEKIIKVKRAEDVTQVVELKSPSLGIWVETAKKKKKKKKKKEFVN